MVYIILAAAFILRLINTNQSVWLDEATTAKVVKTFTFPQIITSFSPSDFHPPFYYLFMDIWTSIFGTSEFALRIPSVIFSLLAGYVVYLIGKKIKNEQVGMWSMVFFLFNPLIVYYSQEARMYLMATFFMMAAFYFYLFVEKSKSTISQIILCNVFIALSFFTFYGSAFFISALYIYLLIQKKYRQFVYIHPGFLFPLIILSPLLYKQLTNSRETMQIVVNWSQVLGKANLKNLFLIPLKFSIGRISWDPKIFYYLISFPWTIFVWFCALKVWPKYKMLFFMLFFPLVLGLLFSLFSPLLQYFRFIYLVPILCLLLGLSLNKSIIRWIIAIGFIVFSLVYLLYPQFHREDWKSLARSLPPSTTVYMIPSSSDPLIYYRPDIKVAPIHEIDKTTSRKLVIIPYTLEIYGINYQQMLEKRGYKLSGNKFFRELTILEYSL